MSHEVTRGYSTERGEELYTKLGELLGIFPSPEAATEYAKRRSNPEKYPFPKVLTPEILRPSKQQSQSFGEYLEGQEINPPPKPGTDLTDMLLDMLWRMNNRVPSVREDQIPLPGTLGPESDPSFWLKPKGSVPSMPQVNPRNIPSFEEFLLQQILAPKDQPEWRAAPTQKAPEMTTLDLVGLLGLLPMMFGGGKVPGGGAKPSQAGMVRAGQRVGPRELLKIYDKVLAAKESLPTEAGKSLDYVSPERVPSVGGVQFVGSGAHGEVYKAGDVTAKLPRFGYLEYILEEALALYRLKDKPEASVKQFLGTVMTPRRDLPAPKKFSELMDHLVSGKISPQDIQDIGLFTRYIPTQKIPFTPGLEERELRTFPDIDAIRRVIAEIARSNVQLTDLHRGNVQYLPPEKGGLASPVILDLGLSSILGRKEGRPLDTGMMQKLMKSSGLKPKELISAKLAREILGKNPEELRADPSLLREFIHKLLTIKEWEPTRSGGKPGDIISAEGGEK